MKASTRMYFNQDRSKIVDEGSEDATFLAFTEGDDIPEAEVKRLGLSESKADPKAAAAEKPETKAEAEPPETKQVVQGEDRVENKARR